MHEQNRIVEAIFRCKMSENFKNIADKYFSNFKNIADKYFSKISKKL